LRVEGRLLQKGRGRKLGYSGGKSAPRKKERDVRGEEGLQREPYIEKKPQYRKI